MESNLIYRFPLRSCVHQANKTLKFKINSTNLIQYFPIMLFILSFFVISPVKTMDLVIDNPDIFSEKSPFVCEIKTKYNWIQMEKISNENEENELELINRNKLNSTIRRITNI